MIELMLVVSVMGIILASSFVSLQHGMPSHELRAASSKMAAELRLARQKAIAENNNYTITFDPATDSYNVWDDDGSDGYHAPGETVRTIHLSETLQLGTIAIGASNSVTFRPNGSADKGGYVEIVGASTSRRRVQIVKPTGSITDVRVAS